MKLILIAAVVLSGFSASMAQNAQEKAFQVKGNTLAVPESVSWIYFSYAVNGERITDSAKVKNGLYQFNGRLAEPVLARVRADYGVTADGKKKPIQPKKDVTLLFLQPGSIEVTHVDSFSNTEVKGSVAHKAYLELEKKLKGYNDQMQELSLAYSALYKQKDETGMKSMEPRFDEVQAQIRKVYLEDAKENPHSPIAVYVVSQYAGWEINADEVEPLYNALPGVTKNLPSARLLKEKIEVAKKTGVGRYAMDFTQNDTLGKPVSLSSLKGKYVLIDFWASWCGPCRAENPNVVTAFNKYKDKGFHVLGVSLDQSNAKEKWMKAIHDDFLTWTHVSDLQYWKNAVAIQYGIQAIPQNFLLDPEGKIIAKNLRGEALQQKLETIFNKP